MKRFTSGILVQEDKILLGKRSSNRVLYPGVWDFIGGHCEEGESFEAGMIRELSEELGIETLEFQLFLEVDKTPEFKLAIYLITCWEGNPRNIDLEEHEFIKWVTFKEAKELQFPDSEYYEILDSLNTFVLSSRF